MADLHPDILEQVLIRLNVSDLIRCKNVCNSWKSFISTSPFIKAHINHNYHIDCNKNDVDRRIVIERTPYSNTSRQYEADNRYFNHHECHLLGSSNGLVCISPFGAELVVANPSTREVKRLKKPLIPNTRSLCWGFGYDSSIDDYKVIVGFTTWEGLTCFQVLTLKSNCWKMIGYLKYSFISRVGILCNEALHWVMKDFSSKNNKKVILSLPLSSKEFKEIPQPDDARYESGIARHQTMRLGIMEECLCVFNYETHVSCETRIDNVWMMKKYNEKNSWGIVGKDVKRKLVVHCLKELKRYNPNKRSLCRDMWFCTSREFIGAPIYVESLVSPHTDEWRKRKRQKFLLKVHCYK